jgi:hypothetical protein
MTMTHDEIIKAIEPALNLFSAMQQRPGARFSVAVEREQLGKAITALHAMKAEAQQVVQGLDARTSIGTLWVEENGTNDLELCPCAAPQLQPGEYMLFAVAAKPNQGGAA